MRIAFLSLMTVPALLGAQTDTSRWSGAFIFDSASISASGARTLSEFLAGRVPHLVVRQTSGVAGAGTRVRIRSLNSFYAPANPVLIVDGVRSDAKEGSLLVDAAAAPSRMDDYAIEDLSRVEVFSGPAAAARYGFGTASGVIAVTTRVTSDSAVRAWTRASGGTSMDAASYPRSYRLYGLRTTDGTVTDNCWVFDRAAGQCQPFELRTRETVGRDFFAPSARWSGSGGGSVGWRAARFNALAGHDRETGLLDRNLANRFRARVGAMSRFGKSGRLAVGAHHLFSMVDLPDDAALAKRLLLPGSGSHELPLHPTTAAPTDADQRMRRSLVSVDVSGSLPSSLRWRLHGGKEWVRERDHWSATSYGISSGGDFLEFAVTQKGTRDHQRHTMHLALDRDLRLPLHRARLGVFASALRSSEFATVDDRSSPFVTSTTWSRRRINTRTLGATYSAAYGSRTALEFGARREGLRLDEMSFGNRTYVNAIASAGIGPRLQSRTDYSHAGRLTLRYGETADVPLIPVEFLTRITTSATLKRIPERSYESEAALKVHAPRDFGEVAATFFHRRTTGVIFPSVESAWPGYREIIASEMILRHHGIEIAGTVRPLRLPQATAELTMLWGLNRRDRATIRSGYAPARYFYPPEDDVSGLTAWTYGKTDTDGDGVIDWREADGIPGPPSFLGSRHPVRSLGTIARIDIAQTLRLTAIFDFAGQFISEAGTEQARCLFGVCRGMNDPSASLPLQARTLTHVPNAYYENASYTRLREVTATFEPRIGMLGHGARISLIGRNLALWTKFSGLDPEVTRQWNTVAGQSDTFVLPVPRTFTLRLDWEI